MKKTICILIGAALLLGGSLFLSAQERTSLLEDKYAESGVAESFKTGTDWIPYPAYSDREGWKKLLGETYAKALVRTGEKFLGYKWRHVPAYVYVLRAETGNSSARNRYNNANRQAFISLVMAELAEGKGRFLKDIADGFWFYSTAGHWSIGGETGGKILPALENEVVALGNVRVSAMLCPVWALFKDEFDKLDPQIGLTFSETLHRIIIDPFLNPENHYWWMADPRTRKLNNWTPWCCHGVLMALFTVETDQEKLNTALRRSLKAVDIYLGDFPADGMCNEGSTYWFQSVVRLVEFLQLLKDKSGGKFNIMPNEFISSMGAYISRCCAGQTAAGKEIVVNYGDSHPFATFDTFSLWKCSDFFESRELRDLALYASWNGSKFKMPSMEKSEGFRALENARTAKSLVKAINNLNDKVKNGDTAQNILMDLREGIPNHTWFPHGQQLFVKTADDWFFSAKAAHNGESHNHNDVGSCVLFVEGSPVLIDPGVGVYTSKTFGPDRYTLWTMVSPWHNVPEINGTPQHQGAQYSAKDITFTSGHKKYSLSFDMSEAYPKSSGCRSWKRSYTVNDKVAGSTLEIRDEFELEARKGCTVERFITAVEPVIVKPGVIHLKTAGKTVEFSYPASLLKAVIDDQTDLDRDLRKTWGERIYRINLNSTESAPTKGSYVMKLKAL